MQEKSGYSLRTVKPTGVKINKDVAVDIESQYKKEFALALTRTKSVLKETCTKSDEILSERVSEYFSCDTYSPLHDTTMRYLKCCSAAVGGGVKAGYSFDG